ncbi:MAG: 2-isopropylmalate synthase [Gammaproteobacteria bacterium TMED222]|nr:MAG: 2-isopropylmalate synthase [Gammaproteobacteria bacterium TMED222]
MKLKEIVNSSINKYSPFKVIDLDDRTWPTQQIVKSPIWCSVDLRDGNQSLIEPMGMEKKLRFFSLLVDLGFKEIEVGFPSASDTEFNFVRELIEKNLIPEDVKIQVLTQAREHLIERTFESVKGAKNVIMHLYNSTSTLQREVVFKQDKNGILKIATDGARLVKDLAIKNTNTNWQFEYSPESFTGTELEYAVEVCNKVNEIWEPNKEIKTIMNLPATVELASPNIYADQIEWMCRNLDQRENVLVSLHPHNDRGTGIAAAELGLMAGADRVEGTLFGNGERTGNVDIVSLALNQLTQGVDPKLDFSDINKVMREVEYCNQLPIHPRHPYAGDLVFTAFSGSHQDAIKKGFDAMRESNDPAWKVPYLPIDPEDVGRNYEAVIRINSQSGKGGVAYIIEKDHGLSLPRRLQIDFSRVIQKIADQSGKELEAELIWETFNKTYIKVEGKYEYLNHEIISKNDKNDQIDEITLSLNIKGKTHTLSGKGNGPIDSFINAISNNLDLNLKVSDYQQNAIASGSDASAAAYIELAIKDQILWGIGINQNTVVASFQAIINGLNRSGY